MTVQYDVVAGQFGGGSPLHLGLRAGMCWTRGVVTPPSFHSTGPAYAQPLCLQRQVLASTAVVSGSNRPQMLWQPPPTTYLMAGEAASRVSFNSNAPLAVGVRVSPPRVSTSAGVRTPGV